MKKVLALSIALAVPTVSMASDKVANDKRFIVGAGVAVGSGEYEIKASGSDARTADLDSVSANFHFGWISQRNNRFLISFESLTYEDAIDEFDASGVRLDWQFVYGESQFQPYWGLGFGVYSSDDLAALTTDWTGESSLAGVSFQLAAGIKYLVNEHVELDLNLQAQAIAWEDVEFRAGYSSTTVEQMTSHGALGFGVDFKF